MSLDSELKKEYELYQSYERFKVYNVFIIKEDGEKRFIYRETKPRTDYGKKLYSKEKVLQEVSKRLEVMNDATKSIEEQLLQ